MVRPYRKIKIRMKKAQITIFIIIGIVILVIAISLIYFSGHIKEKEAEAETIKTQKIPSDLEPLVNYIEACIEDAAKDGIFLLGKQGGAIYKEQGGKTIDYPDSVKGNLFMEHEGLKVPYLIFIPTIGSMKCDPDLPNYPIKSYWMPYPYKKGKGGKPLLEEDKQYKQESCFGRLVTTSKKAMNNTLRLYIEKKILESCDLSPFTKYNIETQDPKLEIESSPSSTLFTLYYPMTITDINTGTKTELKEFIKNIKISVDAISDFVDMINKNDVDDPTYDIRQSFDAYDFRITVIPNAYNNDDIIKVTSNLLKVDGQQFEFVYARRNRFPILEYVYDVSFEDIPLAKDHVINWEDVINQKFAAVDPDEDEVNISVIIGADKLVSHHLTEDSPYQIHVSDINIGNITIRVEATDGEWTDYQEYMIEW
jgi:hypothetical protein